jgi:hypothetical protein
VEPQGLDILDGRDGDAKKAWFLRGFAPESVFFGILLLKMVADWVELGVSLFNRGFRGFSPIIRGPRARKGTRTQGNSCCDLWFSLWDWVELGKEVKQCC